MRIGVIGSMHHTESMLEARDELIRRGHDAYVTSLAAPFVGKSDEEKERIKLEQKEKNDAIREFFRLMPGSDAVLTMNLPRHGIDNYIGANTFMEISVAYYLGQKIFLYNPLPDMPYLRTELEAIKPTIIHRDLSLIS
jgi:hypothetical protein